MLRSLELFGFKSFADKTVFEFSSGITGVVGPNGSGKSNVVDSIKWILGDQSAKSLRGKEMTDVIFNGSSSRGGSQFAEATLVFDNSTRFLPVDLDEVSIGRRLWTSGDSEYLINRNAARLKDVRELFMGTGAGAAAYCIIEQGRVDQILQSNAANRRLIFEEAAGISRFKARRSEAVRRLDRVEQNLLRLTDIVDEVESQVNAVRSQAQRAARYREVSTELEQLWVGMVADDYRQQTMLRQKLEQQREQSSATLKEIRDRQQAAEKQLIEADAALSAVDDELREVEQARSELRSRIASLDTTLRHQSARETELVGEFSRLQRQKVVMDARVAEAENEEQHLQSVLSLEQKRLLDRQSSRESGHQRVQELQESLTSAQTAIEDKRQLLMQQAQQNSETASQLGGLRSELQALTTRQSELNSSREILNHEIQELRESVEQHEQLVQQAAQQQADVESATDELLRTKNDLLSQQKNSTESLAGLREQRSAALARRAVLEDLEDRQEGLGIGVRDILRRAEEATNAPWNLIRGSVSDLLDVDMDNAALLEVALSGRAQLLVIDRLSPLIDYLNSGRSRITGRVGFVSLEDAEVIPRAPRPKTDDSTNSQTTSDTANTNAADGQPGDDSGQPWSGGLSLGMFGDDWLDSVMDEDVSSEFTPQLKVTWIDGTTNETVVRSVFSSSGADTTSLTGKPGVVGRADGLARSPRHLPDLAAHLLADTWVVESLADAVRLSRQMGPDYRFITLQGELVEKNGTLFTGTVRSESAIVSRKSELRRLCNELHKIEHLIKEREIGLQTLGSSIDSADGELQQSRANIEQFAAEHRQAQQHLSDAQKQFSASREQIALLAEQLVAVTKQVEELKSKIDDTHSFQQAGEDQLTLYQQQISDAEQRLIEEQQQIQTLEEERTEDSLELTRSEERLSGVRDAVDRLKEDLQQRRLQQAEAERRLASGNQRIAELNLSSLNVRAEIAELRVQDEQLIDEINSRSENRQQLKIRRQQATQTEQQAREVCRQHESQFHELELKIQGIEHQLETSCERIRDEFQVEIKQAVAEGRSAVAVWLEQQAVPADDAASSEAEVASADEEDTEVDESEDYQPSDGEHDQFSEQSSVKADTSAITMDDVTRILQDELQYAEMREAIDQRVGRLRRQLKKIGNVGMESLDNLTELETRFERLHSQLKDLEAARDALRDMVRRINVESRRMFLESFECIRGFFRELFRRLFGGGEADVILEDPEDVLECAIDVVARPPGKELRSISLLSGGEKTMTAVALLLSIFKSRPSPFCILDEVDAALDDANIGRFVGVLKDFQQETQFIMITHRKPTMAVTDVLYGVTMEESGISKRLSVRFEEIDEQGNFVPRDDSSNRAA